MRSELLILNVGFIGYRNHAAILAGLVEDSGLARITRTYHPNKSQSGPGHTNNLDDLLDCDAVFIASPNDTHIRYLEYLGPRYPGYIFCEKPPVSTAEHLRRLTELDLSAGRTYFNFNLRHSPLHRVTNDVIKAGTFGKLVNARAQVSHGLALLPGHGASWRAKSGMLMNVGIHFVDMFSSLFGRPEKHACFKTNISQIGDGEDTALVCFSFPGGGTAEVFVSYATSYSYEMSILGTELAITYRNGILEVSGPRQTFDGDGRFTSPPTLKSEHHPVRRMQIDSMRESVISFIRHVRDGSPLPIDAFRKSLESTEVLLQAASEAP